MCSSFGSRFSQRSNNKTASLDCNSLTLSEPEALWAGGQIPLHLIVQSSHDLSPFFKKQILYPLLLNRKDQDIGIDR